MYTTYEEAVEALETAELDVIADMGEEVLEACYSDLVYSIAGCCTPEVGSELLRRRS